ncbi:hypothetical protein [Rheinheimera fenheensis]|uniref:hypothetical protein n=1 Tax=Rheinheimera fenheensis TaxID=3152295 RepID=UPI003260D3F7
MKSLSSFNLPCLKSRLTGFFAFVLLAACQPPADDNNVLMQRAQTEPAAAMRLATQRLANAELDAALHWFRQGARLGDTAALAHALQLQQRQQGRLATAQWLQNALDEGSVRNDQLTSVQRAELGLWQSGPAGMAGFTHPAGCQLTLQPVVSQQVGLTTWQRLLTQWQQDTQLQQLAVCFAPAIKLSAIELSCTEQTDSRIQCNYLALSSTVAAGGFSQLLVIAGRGAASYNNGILQLPDNASLALLRHEFMHILGFIDEYRLAADTAAQVCNGTKIYPNILLAEQEATYLQHWQLDADQIALTPVESCAYSGKQMYRVVEAANLMRSFELGLPALYLTLSQRILSAPEDIMPVQYYFAYMARQQQNWPAWQQFMQQAAAQGYQDAIQALAP